MDAKTVSESTSAKPETVAERTSDRELVVTRTFEAPPRLVFDAWTKPELFKRWWVPKSCGMTMLSCEMDVRVGGGYKLVFAFGDDTSKTMAFFGKYLEVVPGARLVWTNDEGEEAGAVTTVTFEERNGKTLLTMRDMHPTKAALDEAISNGSTSGTNETFAQLDELLATGLA